MGNKNTHTYYNIILEQYNIPVAYNNNIILKKYNIPVAYNYNTT